MKPIKLIFSGLQSYRKEQKINFVELGELGMFGIFGPTGAGKSTILDAITLALYGNVERAPNGIRGIMNHFEDQLMVSFEFALGEKLYLAERSYKRNKKEDAITNKVSRLIKLQEEKEIIADKASEVTEAIVELLGMEFKDFTRAVIIPQNRFDQFLKLKEKDRTEMLEKLFSLEEYGEKLTAKVKKLDKTLEMQYEANQKGMTELGDASQETIKDTETQLKEKQKIAGEKDEERKKLKKQLEELEIAAGIYQQKTDMQEKKESLQQQRTEIEKEKQQLHLAKKAEGFEDTLEGVKNLKQEIQEKITELKDKKEEDANIVKALKTAEVQLEEAKEKKQLVNHLKEEELPNLPLAADYEKQIHQLQRDLKDSIELTNEKKKRLALLQKEKVKGKKVLEENETAMGQMKKAKKRMNNILLCRKEVEDVIKGLEKVEDEEKQKKAAELELQKKEEEQNEKQEVLKKLLEGYIQEVRTATGIETLHSLSIAAESILKEAEEKQAKAEAEVTNAVEENMAVELASKLKAGEPCQVCGSIHHPEPAKAGEEVKESVLQTARKKLKAAKEEVKAIRQWFQQVNIQYTTVKNGLEEIQASYKPKWMDKKEDVEKAEADFENALALLQKKLNEITEDYQVTDRETAKTLKGRLEEAEEVHQKVIEEIELKGEEIRRLERQISDVKDNYNQLETSIQTSLEEIKKYDDKAKELTIKKEELVGNTTVAAYEKQIKAQIHELEKEIKMAEETWEKTREKKQAMENSLAILQSSIESNQKYLKGIENQLEIRLVNAGFLDIEHLQDALIEKEKQEVMEKRINSYEKDFDYTLKILEDLEKKAKETPFDKELFENTKELYERAEEQYKIMIKEEGGLQKQLEHLKEKQKRWNELQEQNKQIGEKRGLVTDLLNLLRGKRLVKFLAEEHMRDMAVEASIKLGELTGQRYRLELDDKSSFIMRDDYSGGEGRLVTSLSGGETFLTSLALALALSSKIQLKGQPLGFFFLDEGFGTLDNEKLELVMNTLEKLRKDQRVVGIISHVTELKNRMPRYMEVTPAQQDGAGSKVVIKAN